MLNYAWLFPAIPAASFVLILLFGKRTPGKGAPIGILALGSTFVLSIVAVVQWIQRVDDATPNRAKTRFASAIDTTNDAAVTAADRRPSAVARSASDGNVKAIARMKGKVTAK